MAGMVRVSRSRGFEGCLLAALLLREDSWHPSLALRLCRRQLLKQDIWWVGLRPQLAASDSVSLCRLLVLNSGIRDCGQGQGRSAACPML